MRKLVLFRFLLLVIFLPITIYFIHAQFNSPLKGLPVLDLPDPPRPFSRMDGCAVSPKEAQVHYGESGSEDAWIKLVNDDDTAQVKMVDTGLSFLFRLKSEEVKCFREGSLALVTINNCIRNSKGQCNFNQPYLVYVRAKSVHIISWEYTS